jgi:hypothetical protein
MTGKRRRGEDLRIRLAAASSKEHGKKLAELTLTAVQPTDPAPLLRTIGKEEGQEAGSVAVESVAFALLHFAAAAKSHRVASNRSAQMMVRFNRVDPNTISLWRGRYGEYFRSCAIVSMQT